MDENTNGSGVNQEPEQNQANASSQSGATDQTGNGNYQYNDTTQQADNNTQQSSAQNTNTGSSNNTGWNGGNNNNNNWNTNSNAGNNNGGKKKKHGKAAFAILLCVIFGFCAGIGGYGISRLSGDDLEKDTKTEASASADASNSSSASSDENTTDSSDSTDASSENAEEDETILSSDEESTTEDSAATESSDESDGTTLTQHHEAAQESNVTKVADKVLPAIVSVYNNYTSETQDFFGQTYSSEETSTGSGIIIAETDSELLIVTNNHVVEDEDTLQVQFIDETTAEANIKGTDSDNDLAVIAVSLDDLDQDTLDAISIAELGDSDELLVGQTVIAIGNALGYGQSVTTGVVSALNRELETEDGVTNTYIQTDAAINPGNSGGALCDENGYVIGINSSKLAATQVEGMCYAIPISRAIPIIEDLMTQDTKTKVADEERGYIGISGVSVTSQVASAYNMPEGVYVSEIIEGGGAADSDLRVGDIITGIDGTTITSMEELQAQLAYYAAGDTVTLTVERQTSGGYQEQEIEVTLGDSSTIESAGSSSSDSSSESSSESSSDSSSESSSEASTEESTESSSESSSEESSDASSDASTEESTESSTESSSEESTDSYNEFPWNQW